LTFADTVSPPMYFTGKFTIPGSSQVSASMTYQRLAILCCPYDEGALADVGEALRCAECGRAYPIVDGIPDFL